MFRNQYDNDITTWSPQGRIHQVEYAMEAVKQGACGIGLKSKTHAVLVGLKRAASDLSAHQKKMLRLDSHVGITIAGVTSDARFLSKYMRNECLNNQYAFGEPIPVSRLVASVGDKLQVCTQRYGRRPYGVGMLVAGYDKLGPHIYQTCPSANYFDCKAMAIGARSQSAKTYLERHLDEFLDASLQELIDHAVRALHDSLPSSTTLSTSNFSVAFVGLDTPFTVHDDADLTDYLERLNAATSTAKRAKQTADDAAAVPMDADTSSGTTETAAAAAAAVPGDAPAPEDTSAPEPMTE